MNYSATATKGCINSWSSTKIQAITKVLAYSGWGDDSGELRVHESTMCPHEEFGLAKTTIQRYGALDKKFVIEGSFGEGIRRLGYVYLAAYKVKGKIRRVWHWYALPA